MLVEIKDELFKEFKELKVEKGNGEPVKLYDYVNGLLFNDLTMIREIFKNSEKNVINEKSPFKPGDDPDLPY